MSGRGSNLRRLLELDRDNDLGGARIVAVATNRASCPAAGTSREFAVPTRVFAQRDFGDSEARDAAMRDWLLAQQVELVVLAGYDRVLSRGFTAAFPDRVINIHPSLLPAFGGGMNAVEEALAHGVRVTGCTVHLLGDEVDAGPIILQAAVPVEEDDTPESLHARIQAEEHGILPEAVRLLASGRVHRDGSRVVIRSPEPVA